MSKFAWMVLGWVLGIISALVGSWFLGRWFMKRLMNNMVEYGYPENHNKK